MGEDEYVRWLAENRPEITLIGEMRRAGEGCLHKCDKGDDHTWMGIPSRIMHGRGCPHCSGRIPQDYREWLAEFRPDLTLLEPYRNSLTKTKHQCGEGHVFTAPPGAIKQGRGCPECSDKSSDFDAVYVWEWLVDGEGTGVYKGGLTSVKLGDRRIVRCARTNDMDYRIVFLLRTGGLQARAIEQALLDSGHKVEMPDHVVDGRTEFRYFHPDSRAMATINQLKAIAEGKPLQTQKLVAQQ